MHKPWPSLLAAAAVAAVAAAAQPVHEHRAPTQPPVAAARGTTAEYPRFKREMDAGMARMMQDMHAPGYAGDPDIDFLAMMIPHHEGAVEMARLVLVHGLDPATRRLAEDIVASQVVEIEGMKRRLQMLRRLGEPDAAEFPALGGTRGPAR